MCRIEYLGLENSSQLQVRDIAMDLRTLPTFLYEVSLPLNFKRTWSCGCTVQMYCCPLAENALSVADMMILPEKCLTEMKKGDGEKLTVVPVLCEE